VLHLTRGFGDERVSLPVLDFHYASLRDMAFEITHSPDILTMASTLFPGSCDDCEGTPREHARLPQVVRKTRSSASECHELECGHAWHVTITLEAGIATPIAYAHACDCAVSDHDSRAAWFVAKQHDRFGAYPWGKFKAEGRGAVVIVE